LRKSFLTKNLSEVDLKILGDAMYKKTYVRNDLIIKYGDIGHEYYVLDKGVVEVIVYKEGTDPQDPDLKRKVAFSKFLSSGIGFGEIALLYSDKRTATVRAADICECWAIEGRVFKNIIIK
jgi:cAMP-dependent protein kinase regulator